MYVYRNGLRRLQKNEEKKWWQFYLVALAVTFVVGTLSVFFFALFNPGVQSIGGSVAADTFATEVLPVEELVALPVRLVIPSIEVDAAVQQVGLAPDNVGEMAVPTNFTDVGWYKHGVRPGMRGSAVMAGHFNGREVEEAVFYDLDELVVGDEVIAINAEETEMRFVVVRIETYDYDAPTTDVFVSDDEKVQLNLITCGGEWLAEKNVYDKRTVIFTEQVTIGR